jgi:hypothetical protein
MRRISIIDDGFYHRDEFVDVVDKITRQYVHLLKSTGIGAASVVKAAKNCGWEVSETSSVAVLVSHIARISNYQTPLCRPERWDDSISALALSEFA